MIYYEKRKMLLKIIFTIVVLLFVLEKKGDNFMKQKV